jgi:phage shock protein C
MTNEVRRLYKSRTDRMIDGVCGGIARYIGVDPTLVRVVWVLLTILGGSGILLYIAGMVLIPKEPYVFPTFDAASPATLTTPSSDPSKKNSLLWGILLIIVGLFIFLHNMGFSFWHPFHWFDSDTILPLLLILAGVAFMWGGRNALTAKVETPALSAEPGPESVFGTPATPAGPPRKLYRSFLDKKLFGVCGGIGSYFGIDSTIVRILFVIGAFASSGFFVIAYVLMAIIIPKELPTYRFS